MSQSPPTFNLSALADRLFAERRMMPLAGKIRRSRDLHSLAADLEMALESLNALDALLEIDGAENDFAKTITESALLNYALILYVRATKTTSDERRGFDLRARLSELERLVHDEMCDLRDKAIAHFGSGGIYSGEWQNELVILQVSPDGAKPGIITRRKMIDKRLITRAKEQCEVAHRHLRALSMKKIEEVTEELNKLSPDDFCNEIKQHPLNLDVFLTAPEAGDTVRSSIVEGYRKGIVRHD